jgi:hypothetical protein
MDRMVNISRNAESVIFGRKSMLFVFEFLVPCALQRSVLICHNIRVKLFDS